MSLEIDPINNGNSSSIQETEMINQEIKPNKTVNVVTESQGTIARIKNAFLEKLDSIKLFTNQFRNKAEEFQHIELAEIEQTTNPFYEKKEQFKELHLDKNTSIIFNEQTKKYTLISKPPPISNLVISGGGAKGVVLPGVIKAMEIPKDQLEEVQTNILRQDEAVKNLQELPHEEIVYDKGESLRDQLVNVAGSSVGAITAALIAVGMSADDISKATGNVDFKALLGKGTGPILKDGVPMQQFIQKGLEESISKNLTQHFNVSNLDQITKEMIENKEDLWKLLNELKEKEQITQDLKEKFEVKSLDEITADKPGYDENVEKLLKTLEENVSVTFSALRSLRELDPKSFKELTVTATCRENGKTLYFDADSTPNLDIATACRASASLPIFLKPVTISRDKFSDSYQEKLPKTDPITFVDGGYLDNIPVGIMESKQDDPIARGKKEQNLQTLALVFDETKVKEGEQSPFQEVKVKRHALYNSSSLKERLVRDIAAKLFGRIKTDERNTMSKEAGLERIREDYIQRSIPLRVDVKTKDFKKAKLQEKEYSDKGFKQAVDFLATHEGELIARKFKSFDDLLKYVPQAIQDENFDGINKFREEMRKEM